MSLTGPVVWTVDKLEALREGIEESRRLGQSTVIWVEKARPSYLGYRSREHAWPLPLAESTLDRVFQLFENAPVRAYPENREGQEP